MPCSTPELRTLPKVDYDGGNHVHVCLIRNPDVDIDPWSRFGSNKYFVTECMSEIINIARRHIHLFLLSFRAAIFVDTVFGSWVTPKAEFSCSLWVSWTIMLSDPSRVLLNNLSAGSFIVKLLFLPRCFTLDHTSVFLLALPCWLQNKEFDSRRRSETTGYRS